MTNPAWRRDGLIVLLSILVQALLGLFLGHLFETRFNMATGYLVGTGQNPYIAKDLSTIFHNHYFQGITSIGYPPPWPLLLGLIYSCTYKLVPGFLFYNIAIKIPIIAANICLAYLVAHVLKEIGTSQKTLRSAWLFMLFNPLILYCSTAWGQFDSIVGLASLGSLVLLSSGSLIGSGIMLALAISLKPIALPLAPVIATHLLAKSVSRTVRYAAVVAGSVVVFCAVPFFVFGWNPSVIFRNWNAHCSVAGCMSPLSFLELHQGPFFLKESFWPLGWLWVPGLTIASFFLWNKSDGLTELVRKSLALMMVFFLTRSWVSEPNILMVVPLLVIAVSSGVLNRFFLSGVWILSLAFTFFNASTPLLLFPTMPDVMDGLMRFADHFRFQRLVIRTIVLVPWTIMGWWIVVGCLKKKNAAAQLQ
jgi:hypothetical protein